MRKRKTFPALSTDDDIIIDWTINPMFSWYKRKFLIGELKFEVL
jgi:hypothetical protein